MELVPKDARVLEFGCATGYMSEQLRQRRNATVVGVEVSPEAAALAEARCDRVIVGDAELLDYDELFEDEKFEAILFADVLEHLRYPGALLERVRDLLAEDGVVIASVPNVAHGSVRLALLVGDFRYRPTGLLDETHLRFFTRTGIRDLFEEAGYLVTHWIRQHLDVDEGEVSFPRDVLTEDVRALLARDRESTVYQFVVRARPMTESALIHELRRNVSSDADALQQTPGAQAAQAEETQARQGELVREIEALRQTHLDDQTQLTTARDELDSALRNQAELRRLLFESQDELARRDTEIARLAREIELMKLSRAWRIAQHYRRLRPSVNR